MSVSVEHNRRSVYYALARVVDDRTLLQQAFDLWESRFSGSKLFRVTQYMDALRDDVGLADTQRRNLAVAIYSAMAKGEDELRPVPGAVLGEAPAGAQAPGNTAAVSDKPSGSPRQVVFATLISSLAEGVLKKGGRDAVSEFGAAITDSMESSKLNGTALPRINAWVEAEYAPREAPVDVPDEDQNGIVHALYLAACDVLGPVQADRLLSRAVGVAGELPEADDFAPASLL